MADGSQSAKPKHPGGRPTLFKPEYVLQAQALSRLGLTDIEMADVFGVSVRTLNRWKIDSEEFCHSLTVGKGHADNRAERSLYEKAVGFGFVEQQAIKIKVGQYEERVEVVDVERQMPPDTGALIFWLKNRRRDDWRDRIEHTGADGGAIQVASQVDVRLLNDEERDVLRELLVRAQQRQLEGPGVIEGEFSEVEE